MSETQVQVVDPVKKLIDDLAQLSGASRLVLFRENLTSEQRTTIERAARNVAYEGEDGDVETSFNRTFGYKHWDGAHAMAEVTKEFFGIALGRVIETFFGDTPPSMVSINTGVDTTAQVPWGKLEIPALDRAQMETRVATRDGAAVFHLSIMARRKHEDKINDFFKAIEERLETNSIYRGKAIIGLDKPNFIDTDAIDPDSVVYCQETQDQLDGTLWSVLRYTEEMRRDGLPRKRAVLLHGDYGTGKSLTGRKTARIAVDHGWTFIAAKAGEDDITEALQMARLYEPAVVFFEDVDTEADAEDEDEISTLLDRFDGIMAKDVEVVVVLTTNHIDKIHKGMLRPGRLDALVELGKLDVDGIERVIVKAVSPERLGEIDYTEVFAAMDGFTPAFVHEVVTRAASVALARASGAPQYSLLTTDLVTAANSLRPQLDRMNEARENFGEPTVENALTEIVRKVVHGADIVDMDGDPTGTSIAVSNGNGN